MAKTELVGYRIKKFVETKNTVVLVLDKPTTKAPVFINTSDVKTIREVEKEYMAYVIQQSRTLSDAAKILGIDLSTLWRKRQEYNLT